MALEYGLDPRSSIMEVLGQDREWLTRDGVVVALDEMTATHRANTLRFLRRRPRVLTQAWIMAAYGLLGGVRGEMAADLIEREIDHEIDQMIALGDAGWLEAQPLVIRLAEMVRRDTAIHRGLMVTGKEWWE